MRGMLAYIIARSGSPSASAHERGIKLSNFRKHDLVLFLLSRPRCSTPELGLVGNDLLFFVCRGNFVGGPDYTVKIT